MRDSKNSRTKRIMMTAAALSLGLLGMPSTAGATSAAPDRDASSIVCAGSADLTYTPGLTYTRSVVRHDVDYRYEHCRTRNQPGVVSGAFQAVTQQFESCEDLQAGQSPYTYTMPIDWNDGTRSLATVSVVREPRFPVPVFTLTGVVDTGHFAGNDLAMDVVFYKNSADLPECDTPEGLTRLSGALFLSLTPPV